MSASISRSSRCCSSSIRLWRRCPLTLRRNTAQRWRRFWDSHPRVAAEAPAPIPAPAAIAIPPLATDDPEGAAIAIVGMSGVFPMARDLDAFWQNLAEGRDCDPRGAAEDRWDWRAYWGDPATDAGRTNVKWGGFIDGVGEFDPAFFGISAPEARMMDPQHRLLLTQAWRAIEDAGTRRAA